MSKPDPPTPPDPLRTASAATATNVSTAIANAFLNNTNQTTPQGSVNYDQTGTYTFTDPTSGAEYNIPRFTANQTLPPLQQATLDQSNAAKYNLANLANAQSARVSGLLGSNLNLSGAPAGGDASALGSDRFGPVPFGTFNNPGNPLTSLGDYAPQQTGFADAGQQLSALQRPYGQEQTAFGGVQGPQFGIDNASGSPQLYFAGDGGQQYGFAGTQGPIYGYGSAGDITRNYGPADDFSSDRQRVEQSLFDRLQPQLDRDRSRLEQQLQDQGIRYGSPAYSQAMLDFNRQSNDARLAVTQTAGQEQQRMMDEAAQRAGFQNSAQQQAYQQEQGRGAFYNTAEQQAFGEAQARGQFVNAAQQAAYQQFLGRGQFANAAQQQAYEQALGRGQFSNAAQQQAFGQEQARGTFANQALAQQYQEQLGAGQFANAAQQAAYAQAQGRGQFANDALGQAFAEQAQAAQFSQAGQAATYQQELARDQYQNAASAQAFAEAQSQFNAQNAARNQYLAESYANRNQPINEITALLSGSQVTNPNFVNAPSTQIPTTDIANLVNQNFAQQLGIYQQQSAQSQALLGGILGLGGNLARAGATLSDRREKENIHRIGTVFATTDHVSDVDADELPIYRYNYKDDPADSQRVGPMAQDLEQIDPSAVRTIGGRKYIDNATMGAILRAA